MFAVYSETLMLLLCLHFTELTDTLKHGYNNSIGTVTTCFYQSSSVEFCGTVSWVLICSYRTLLNLPTLWPSIGGHQRGFPPQIGPLSVQTTPVTPHGTHFFLNLHVPCCLGCRSWCLSFCLYPKMTYSRFAYT